MNNILKTLEEKANKELNLIQEEEEKGLLDLKEDFKEKSTEKKAKEKDALEKSLQKELSALTQQLSFKYNLGIGAKKAEGLNEVYQKAQEKLVSLPEEEMEKLLKKMLNALPQKEGFVLASRKTFSLLKKLVKSEKVKIEEGLKEEGFIFKSQGLEIDFRFKEVLKELKEQIEPALAKIIYA